MPLSPIDEVIIMLLSPEDMLQNSDVRELEQEYTDWTYADEILDTISNSFEDDDDDFDEDDFDDDDFADHLNDGFGQLCDARCFHSLVV